MAAVALFTFATSVRPVRDDDRRGGHGGWTSIAAEIVAAQVGLILLMRFVLAIRFDMEIWSGLLHPLAMAVLICIMVNSNAMDPCGRRLPLKGRVYDTRNQFVAH